MADQSNFVGNSSCEQKCRRKYFINFDRNTNGNKTFDSIISFSCIVSNTLRNFISGQNIN